MEQHEVRFTKREELAVLADDAKAILDRAMQVEDSNPLVGDLLDIIEALAGGFSEQSIHAFAYINASDDRAKLARKGVVTAQDRLDMDTLALKVERYKAQVRRGAAMHKPLIDACKQGLNLGGPR